MIDYEKYHRDGYGVFRIEDLLSPEDVVQFKVLAEQARNIPLTDQYYQYTLSVFGFHNDPAWPFKVHIDEVEDRLAKIQAEGLKATQRWYECTINAGRIKDSFHALVHKFLVKFYPELAGEPRSLPVHYQDAITIYKDGDYTEPHRDGRNQGRVCALLMYLTPEEEYNDGGGELLVMPEDPNNIIPLMAVKPVRGNVVLLDFNNHNPLHGVEVVKNKFVRHCYISFVWNTTRMDPNIRPKGYS